MIISRLDLKAFGCFTDVTLDLSAGPRRLHLVYGPNESGKSTSLRAITSLLFGIPHRTDDSYLHSHSKMRIGGLLVDGATQLECVRRKGRKKTLRDGDDDGLLDESLLDEMLGGISQETFLHRFGLSHQELVSGGAAILSGEGDLGQILFSAGAGMGKLREIQQDLEEASRGLFTPQGSKSPINAAIRRLEEKRNDLRQAQVPPAEFADLRDQFDQRRQTLDQLSAQVHDGTISLTGLRQLKQALPLLPQWRSTKQSLRQYEATPVLDEAFTDRRRDAWRDRELAKSQCEQLETQIEEATDQLESIPADSTVLSHQAEIEAIFQHAAARDKAEQQRLRLMHQREEVNRRIEDLLSRMPVDLPGEDLESQQCAALETAVEQLKVSDSVRSRIHQLASSHQKLISQRNDASDAVESTKRRLADVTQERETLGTPGDPTIVSSVLDSVGNPQTLLEDLAEQQQVCDQYRRRCDKLVRRLTGFDGSAEQAAELRLPDASLRERLADNFRACQNELQTHQQNRQRLQQERAEKERQYREEQTDLRLPTLKELESARAERDQVARQVSELADSNSSADGKTLRAAITNLREQIHSTDRVADTIRDHYERVHRRELLSEDINALDQRLVECDAAIAGAEERLGVAEGEWKKVWKQQGVDAGEVDRMQRWIDDHEKVCEACEDLQDGRRRLEQLQRRVATAAVRIRRVLDACGAKQTIAATTAAQGGLFDQPEPDDLLAVYDEALSTRDALTRSRHQYDQLSQRRNELAEELPKAEMRFEAAQREVEKWREEWRCNTASFVKPDQAGTDEVLQMLDQITELHRQKEKLDDLERQIEFIDKDESDYRQRVARVSAAVSHPVSDPWRPASVAMTLHQQLQTLLSAAQRHETLSEQIESFRQKLAEAKAQRSACEAALQQMCEEAECGRPEELPEIERSSRRRSELESTVEHLKNQLTMLSGDQPLEKFIALAEKQPLGVLEVEIEEREKQLQELKEQQSKIQQEIGALDHELKRIDGSGRAAELVQSIQLDAGELSRQCDQYARAKTASLILRHAIEHYRDANQSPILAHANKYFRQLTCEDYRELRPDYDPNGKTTLIGVHREGQHVPAASMSDGTADALYLALRLASLEHQIEQTKPIPLIIDDCLIQLDDRRAAAALSAFRDLSERTQVILFTHHQHVIELAKENLAEGDFHVHSLGS